MTKGTSSEAYDAFAYAYDRALGERFFKAASRMVGEALERHPTPKRTHLDVACGTGLTVRWFRDRGWKSTGVDASIPMLQIAGGGVAGDMRALPFRRRFARVTCLYDSLNHLLEPEDLQAAFHSVRGVMDADSLFLFDVNHPEIYPEVWGLSEPYIARGKDYHLEIATTYRKREKIGRAAVTGWAKINGVRVDIREQHRQRAYNEREITRMLNAAGLAPVEVLDFDPYDEGEAINAATVKLFFVARPS
ncbi:MAG TPA: methyltransferase domain-containing protein [Thermoanaerobaculia bacterium]